MAPKAKVSARDEAVAARDEHEQTARRWLSDKAAATNKLAELLERSGDMILDDPDAVESLSSQISAARTRLELGDRAIAEASRRYGVSAREAVLAKAAELDEPIRLAEAAIEEHQRRTEELLTPLIEHTRQQWRPQTLDDLDGAGPRSMPASVKAMRCSELADLCDQRDRLVASADRVPPLDAMDTGLARASLRLLETDGSISAASRANVVGCAEALRREADELNDGKDQRIWQLAEAHRDLWPAMEDAYRQQVPAMPNEDWLLNGWEVPSGDLQTVRDEVVRIGQRQAQLRAEASIWDAALAAEQVQAA